MTVAELIAALQEMEPTLQVAFPVTDNRFGTRVVTAKAVYTVAQTSAIMPNGAHVRLVYLNPPFESLDPKLVEKVKSEPR